MSNEILSLGELLQLQSEGVSLPLSVDQIIDIEAMGGIVDLETGDIYWGAADSHTFTLTEKGKALLEDD